MSEFINLLDIVYSPLTFNEWLQLVSYGEISFLFVAKSLWRPVFSVDEIYTLYITAIRSTSGLSDSVLDWLFVYIPITAQNTVRSLVYYILLSFANITELEKATRVNMAAKILNHTRHLFSTSEFSSIMITYFCDDCLANDDDFLRVKYGFRSVIQYPITLNACAVVDQHFIYNSIADLCCTSSNFERIKAIFRIMEIDGLQLGEIMVRIRGRFENSPASIEHILKFLMLQYFSITHQSLLPAHYCSLENHVHDPDAFKYLLHIIDNPTIDIKANVRRLLWKTPTLEVMKEGFKIINYSMDLVITFIPSFFIDESAPDLDAKFSWLALQFTGAHIQRLYNIMNTKSLYKMGNGRRHFILKLIIHQKAIVRLVKLRQSCREMSARCKKFRVLHQLALSPTGAFHDNFPGGELYRNSMDRLENIVAQN